MKMEAEQEIQENVYWTDIGPSEWLFAVMNVSFNINDIMKQRGMGSQMHAYEKNWRIISETGTGDWWNVNSL
jgi:hypothetical protein